MPVIITNMNQKGETSLSLVPYAGDPLSRAQHWTTLSSEELRRRTVLACRDRDAEALWALTEAYFTTYGASGARASRHTLRAYHHGLKVYLDFAGTAAVNLLHPARDPGRPFLRLREARRLMLTREMLLLKYKLKILKITVEAPERAIKVEIDGTAAVIYRCCC